MPEPPLVRGSRETDSEVSFSAGTGQITPRVPGGWIFLGPSGLRAGWAILIFAFLIFVLTRLLAPLAFALVRQDWQGALPPSIAFAIKIAEFAAVLLATLLFAVLEGRSLLSYGFGGRERALRFVCGLLWGFVCISALVLTLWKLGFLTLTGSRLAAGPALLYAAKWAAVFLLTGLAEEATFRGYAQFTLTRGIGFGWAALVLALTFGAIHSGNGGESPIGLVAAGAIGLVFCLSLWYTGSLWWAVGFHAAWDWGESYFYGTADSGLLAQGHLLRARAVGASLWSGGLTGPEGSLLIFPLLALIAVLMVLWWGKRAEKPFRGMGWRGQ